MKTRIYYSQVPNYVTVERDDIFRERVATEYFAPDGGGYVKVNDGDRYPQVCNGLHRRGSTLVWKPEHCSLIDLIRREYRANRRDETNRVR